MTYAVGASRLPFGRLRTGGRAVLPISCAAVKSARSASWSDCKHAQRATAAIDDLERRGDHNRAGGRKLVEIAQAGEAELAGTVHQRMVGKRRVEGAGLARVGADRLDADAQDIALAGQEFR